MTPAHPAPLPYLGDAPPHVRTQIRDAFYAWLQDPAHQTRQITGKLYAQTDHGPRCCAFGALLMTGCD